MSSTAPPDVRPARLAAPDYERRFADAAPRLSSAQAVLEAERCLYCHDAPCAQACPTAIDVPRFIRRIAEGNLRGAATAILEANPLGGTCARVCPTEELCEQACVRRDEAGAGQGQPVAIGRLQRHAVDAVMDRPVARLLPRAPSSGRRVAVVGAGPAGLACALGLARLGHEVVLHEARPKGGGLNEYGLAAYKMAGGYAARELDWLLGLGGITLRCDWRLRSAADLALLREQYEAVYLAIGLGVTAPLGLPGEALAGIRDAVDFIAELRQAPDRSRLPVGRRVVVIGGGMTAIDAAVQSRLLGAEQVDIVYRRGPEAMGASLAERHWAQTHGVTLHHHLAPVGFEGGAHDADGREHVTAVRFARQRADGAALIATGEVELFPADQVLRAVGQRLDARLLEGSGLRIENGRIAAAGDGSTGVSGIWAGGDCRAGGRDLTVVAVEDGKRAAHAIHAHLTST